MHGEHVEALQPVAAGCLEQLASFVQGKGARLYPTCVRRIDGFGDVARCQVPPKGLLECPVQNDMQILNRPGRESGVKLLTVEALQVGRHKLSKLDSAERGLDVYPDQPLVALEGNGLNGAFDGVV